VNRSLTWRGCVVNITASRLTDYFRGKFVNIVDFPSSNALAFKESSILGIIQWLPVRFETALQVFEF